MAWLLRILVLLVAGAVLLVFLAMAALMLLLSCLIMLNAVQRYKNMAAGQPTRGLHSDDVIEAEVREVKDKPPQLPR